MGENVVESIAAPVAAGLPLEVEDVEGIEALSALEGEWDALVERTAEPTPFLRAGWLRAWWAAFGTGTPVVVTVRDARARLVGAALLSRRRARFHGMPVRLLTLASNVHSNRPDLLAEASRAEAVGRALADWAHDVRREWTVFFLDHVPANSPVVAAFRAEIERLGHGTFDKPRETPPVIRIGEGYETFLKTLASKWKSNLRNREKRFAATGEVVHETIREELPDLDARLDECFALEAKTWKGAAGSAIVNDPATLAFYRAIVHDAAKNGALALQTLRTDGRLAAFQIDLVHRGIEYVLKIGYEPELGALGPGALLMRRTIEQACAAGLAAVDLLGDDMSWKRDWTKERRPHVRVLAYGRGPAGLALEILEKDAIPAAKRIRDRVRARTRARTKKESTP